MSEREEQAAEGYAGGAAPSGEAAGSEAGSEAASEAPQTLAGLASEAEGPGSTGRGRRRGGGSRSGGRSGSGGRRRQTGPTPMARAMVKVCLVLGPLLLVPGLWAVGILLSLPVPMEGKPHADKVAYLMLLCWPLAGILIGGALFYAKQHAQHDAKQ